VPIVDPHDCFFLGEGCHASSARVSFRLLVLSEGPRGHKIFHHVAIFELVIDKVCMVRTSLLEESLEVVYRWSCLVLDTAPNDHDTLLVIVVHFLVIVIIAGHCSNSLRAPLLPLLVAFGGLLCALDGNVGWHCLAVVGNRFATAWDKERSGHLLVDGVLGGDVDQLIGVPNDVV
jgi:hypothetical protein